MRTMPAMTWHDIADRSTAHIGDTTLLIRDMGGRFMLWLLPDLFGTLLDARTLADAKREAEVEFKRRTFQPARSAP